jgi:hypothetical protein
MRSSRLAAAGVAFGLLALIAGGLQAWAFLQTQYPRSAVLAVFALSVGGCVTVAAVRAWRRARD